MTILTEGTSSFFLTSTAVLLETDRDIASSWASEYIFTNPALKWVVGKYVEADNANSNGQYWTLEDLRMSQPTIKYSPMNISHRQNDIVGTFVASELMYPTTSDSNPYIETLGAYWKYYFPEQLSEVEAAFRTGSLHLSMECVAESVTCGGEAGCGQTFDYAGPMSQNYCEHIQNRSAFRQLNNPHFLGGALILPPDRPGWKNADVKELAKGTSDELREKIYTSIAKETPHLSPSEWESLMFSIIEQHRLAN